MGPGDGTAAMFTGMPDVDIDGDGEFDGIRMDFDGDGLFDDALGDDDADGLADYLALDLDDDGSPEARYTDDGSGTWTLTATGPPGPLRWFGLDGVEHVGDPADIDGDGQPERLLDANRDGLADRALTDDGHGEGGWVDTDGDGRWDVTLSDTDADGAADDAAAL